MNCKPQFTVYGSRPHLTTNPLTHRLRTWPSGPYPRKNKMGPENEGIPSTRCAFLRENSSVVRARFETASRKRGVSLRRLLGRFERASRLFRERSQGCSRSFEGIEVLLTVHCSRHHCLPRLRSSSVRASRLPTTVQPTPTRFH